MNLSLPHLIAHFQVDVDCCAPRAEIVSGLMRAEDTVLELDFLGAGDSIM